MNSLTALLLAFCQIESVFAQVPVPAVGEYAKPLPGQIRGPCPALNTLANHGYLRRDGGDVSSDEVKKVMKEVLNVGTDVTSAILLRADSLNVTENNHFNMARLQPHANATQEGPEHDASQVHDDFFFNQDAMTPNKTLIEQMISFGDGNYLTMEQMGKFQAARIADSKARNPTFHLQGVASLITVAQAAIMFPTFADPNRGLQTDFIRTFYGEERLPDNFKKTDEPTSLTNVIPAMARVKNAAGLDFCPSQFIRTIVAQVDPVFQFNCDETTTSSTPSSSIASVIKDNVPNKTMPAGKGPVAIALNSSTTHGSSNVGLVVFLAFAAIFAL